MITTFMSFDFPLLIHNFVHVYMLCFNLMQSDTSDVELWADEDVDGSDLAVTNPDCEDGSSSSSSGSVLKIVPSLGPRTSDEITAKDKQAESLKPLLRLYLFFLFMFQTLFRLSDTALDVLLKFMKMFFKTLQHQFSAFPKTFTDVIPDNIKSARNTLGNSRDRFDRYVCCPGCDSLYRMSDCVLKKSNGTLESAECTFIRFPLHPQRCHRKPCAVRLMKEIKHASGRKSFYPKRVYCYRSVIDSLQELLLRPSFAEQCELWRSQQNDSGVYRDIFDARIWKEFLTFDGVPFLSVPGNYAFQINVDWFNPYKHTQHSEGAIYLSVLNLPCRERYLQENIILAGVIPGPKEPSLVMNSFLQPIIDELKQLWSGVIMKNCSGHSIVVRAALISCTCDIPASRKLCGFVGHNAFRGCSRCLLTFPTECFGEKPDYSNFDKSLWVLRTIQETREKASNYKDARTKAAQVKIERDYGIRYTALHELPYFDTVRMCCVDPMHNLLLGTAKHITEIWKKQSILTSKDFGIIQERVNSFISPADIGRIPSKISSGFSGFTAEQWKNWVIIFSLYALKDILPWKHYQCWHYFVKVCFLLCRRTVTEQHLEESDHLMDEFWKAFKDLYGKEACTMNMHLHGHLTECIRDFGPVYSFWCFAYERMNGILGEYHTNNHHISVQFMRRFLDSKEYAPHKWPKEFAKDYLPLLNHCIYNKGSLMQTNLETEIQSQKYRALPPIREFVLSEIQKSELRRYFDVETSGQAYHVLSLCQKSKTLVISEFVLGAKDSRHAKTSFVLASRSVSRDRVELAEIQLSKTVTLWVACVRIFLEHPCKVWFGHPVQVWTAVASPETYLIPVTNIVSRLVYTKCRRDFGATKDDLVYVVVPLLSNEISA